MTVPFSNYARSFANLQPVVCAEVTRAAECGEFILKSRVRELEVTICERTGARFAVATASATGAIQIGLKALGVGPGTEVLVPDWGFPSPVNAILHLGGRPVFVDVREESGVMDAADIERRITDKTGAILPMHMGRSLANMQAIAAVAKAARIPVLEDSAVAFGASIEGRAAGRWGEAGVYSFFPSKPLPGIADAGMLVTDDERVARRCRRLRNHGQDDGERFVYKEVGWNNRMDEIAAGVVLNQLRCFDTMLTRRAAIAAYYDNALVGVRRCVKPLITLAGQCLHTYVVRACLRDSAREYLGSCGIETQPFQAMPLHLHPGFAFLGYRGGDYPAAERLAAQTLALPFYPALTDEELAYVVEKLETFYD